MDSIRLFMTSFVSFMYTDLYTFGFQVPISISKAFSVYFVSNSVILVPG